MFHAKYAEIPNSDRALLSGSRSQQWREFRCLCKRGASPPRQLVLWPHVLNRGAAPIQLQTFPKTPVSVSFSSSFFSLSLSSQFTSPPFLFWFSSIGRAEVFGSRLRRPVCPSCCSSRLSSLSWPCRSLAQLLKRCVRLGKPS